MTISISQLRDRVAAQFPDVEQVDDSVIRFTKKIGNKPYAVYYLDIAQEFPNSQEMLTKYQDRVIGSHYFEGSKSLQWSNYLYFITSSERLISEEAFDAKELIERDRNYARKYVITEEELDVVLAPQLITPDAAAPHAGILSIWTELLIDADLDSAILGDGDLPTRLKIIETSFNEPKRRTEITRLYKQIDAQPFIRSITLNKFRAYPSQRSFEFGKVNLIFGRNGSGKTSLLEAIELFYCGRNKRNPDANPAYTLTVAYDGGISKTATSSRKAQAFRDMNLLWYGQPEIKTNNLYQSFSQFNFLDTDAAVDLAASTSRIEDDLSKLLVGPEASKVWKCIERVSDEVAKILKGINPLKNQLKGELALLEKRIAEASGVRQESDSIRDRIKTMMDRIGWRGIQEDKEMFAMSLIEPLAEMVPIAQQATKMDWIASPISIENMTTYCVAAKVASEKAEEDLRRLEILRKEQRKIEDMINRERRATDTAKQVRQFIDVGLLSRVDELGDLQARVSALSGRLAGLEINVFDTVPVADLEASVAGYHASLASKRSSAEAALADAKKEYMKYSKLRDQSINLGQQLREIASKILQDSLNPDECPLCHTRFVSGDLEKHINIGIDQHIEALGQSLLTRLREQEVVLRDIISKETASESLMKFCGRSALAVDMSIQSALGELNNSRRSLAASTERLDVLRSEIQTLESQGFSVSILEKITDQLRELGKSTNLRSGDDVSQLLLTIDRSAKSLSETLEAHKKDVYELQHTLSEALNSIDSEGHDLAGKLTQVRERLIETEAVKERLGEFSSLFPWPIRKPLIELVVEAESIRGVAAELQSALGKEQQAQTSYASSVNRKKQLENELVKLLPRIEKYNKAQSALVKLQKNHSLNSAMEASLQENRAAIETIFSQIHSPAEFRGLGNNWSTLIRKIDGREAKLTEISTGQRAAFALSVFMAQNAKLKVAPPVILIDDPIAHVDDMNSLSFLDYLREVALKGRRQIYFATANEKLAALFERKFDFLGPEEFRRFNLTRIT